MASKVVIPLVACMLALAGCATVQTAGKPAQTSASGKSGDAKDNKSKEPVPLARPYTTPADPYPSTYMPP